jgi:hypothetical protein
MSDRTYAQLGGVSNLQPRFDEGGSSVPTGAMSAPSIAHLLASEDVIVAAVAPDEDHTQAHPHVGPELDVLQRRDIARELLRARLRHALDVRERRSAWELAFLMLIGALCVLLAAPPVVQIVLAARGVQV